MLQSFRQVYENINFEAKNHWPILIMNEIDSAGGKTSLAANIKGVAHNFMMFFWKFFHFIFEFFSFLS